MVESVLNCGIYFKKNFFHNQYELGLSHVGHVGHVFSFLSEHKCGENVWVFCI